MLTRIDFHRFSSSLIPSILTCSIITKSLATMKSKMGMIVRAAGNGKAGKARNRWIWMWLVVQQIGFIVSVCFLAWAVETPRQSCPRSTPFLIGTVHPKPKMHLDRLDKSSRRTYYIEPFLQQQNGNPLSAWSMLHLTLDVSPACHFLPISKSLSKIISKRAY